MTSLITIEDVMTDSAAFGDLFSGQSWAAWRAILKAAYALPLTAEERSIFDSVSGGREPPTQRVRELWLVVGRRGGKDSVASLVATFAAGIEEAHVGRLRPGELATIACIASDRDQARIVHRYVKGLFNEHPDLSQMIVNETANSLLLNNEAEILVSTNSFRSARGRAYLAVILDECAFYRDENSASPDVELFRALVPGMATLAPESIVIGISSPHKAKGLLYDKFAKHFGQNDDRVLVIQAPSLTMNPTLDPSERDAAFEEDPEAASAEWDAQFRRDIADFISRELVEAATDRDVVVRPRLDRVKYYAFVDVAGGTGKDSFTAAISHAEGNMAVLDAVVEIRPPFSPNAAVEQVAALLAEYGCTSIEGDKYAAGFTIDAFAKVGIRYVPTERDRSQIYLETLPLFSSGRVRLLDHKRLANQFVLLERRTVSSGRDKVDHPRGGHDDISNAAAGALIAARQKRVMTISQEAIAASAASPRARVAMPGANFSQPFIRH
ncbi:terminase [Rhizobium sp. CB3090]|uniref:terminase n=1 Tax=Rhizobium sp. CB3090 TaxID=3039156 RepID=UPI0024B04848|nr:terminase [Rhizobium sp. CB3090]WFU09100.1 terminase [Rhizobium sp. CB3090]